jgi:hypothetical protein
VLVEGVSLDPSPPSMMLPVSLKFLHLKVLVVELDLTPRSPEPS